MPSRETEPCLTWDNSAAAASAAAHFASATIARDTAYISHSEIQTGLSVDAEHWSPDLAGLYAGKLAALRGDYDLLTASDAAGAIIGIAVVVWEQSARRRFAVLEDMVIDPSRRSVGLGRTLLSAVRARVIERDVAWLFLESGVRNHRAHGFFERAGFTMVSHVYAMNLAAPDG